MWEPRHHFPGISPAKTCGFVPLFYFLISTCARFGLLASRGVTEVRGRRANGSSERREVKLFQEGCSQKQGGTEPEPKEEQTLDTSCRDIGRPVNRWIWQWGATALVIRQRRLGKQVNAQMESGWQASDGRVSLSVFLPSKRKTETLFYCLGTRFSVWQIITFHPGLQWVSLAQLVILKRTAKLDCRPRKPIIFSVCLQLPANFVKPYTCSKWDKKKAITWLRCVWKTSRHYTEHMYGQQQMSCSFAAFYP